MDYFRPITAPYFPMYIKPRNFAKRQCKLQWLTPLNLRPSKARRATCSTQGECEHVNKFAANRIPDVGNTCHVFHTKKERHVGLAALIGHGFPSQPHTCFGSKTLVIVICVYSTGPVHTGNRVWGSGFGVMEFGV